METQEEEKKEVKGFRLPNKVVTVRLVDRARGAVKDPNHVGYNMLPGTSFELVPAREKGSNVLRCPLTEDERKFFENKALSGMAFETGDLSPHQPKAMNYWYSKKARVSLTDKPRVLNLSVANDYLTYKILLSNTDYIAPTAAEEFSKKSYVFVITSEEEEQAKVITKGDKNKRAWKIAGNMENDTEKMINYLSMVGKRPSANSDRKWLVAEIDKQVETNTDEFLSIMEDELFDTRVLLTKSLQIGTIKRDGHKYFLADGQELCDKGDVNNLNTALRFINDPKNQDISLMLEAKLNIED
jgi:hypothetical protein